MAATLPRVLLVADQIPPAARGISALLSRTDLRFQITSMKSAVEDLRSREFAAAVVLAPHTYFNGQQQTLVQVLDALCDKHVGAVLLTFSPKDRAAAASLGQGEGLMAVPHTCSTTELAGRLAGLVAAKPLIDQLQRENAVLRRFDTGLNNQMNQLDEEMRLAARLQIDFLPHKLPDFNGCAFNVLFRPASYVSGDIYDAFQLDEDHVGFYVADAVGHGMPAALLTIFIKRALRCREVLDSGGIRIIPPSESLGQLNTDLIGQQLSMCQFVTMIYCILNTRTRELQYARAGHPLPLLFRTGGRVLDLDVEGALLGVFPNEDFPLATIQLEPGDTVLLYSDGFEVAFGDPSGPGNDRYREEFAKLAGIDPKARLETLAQELDQQAGSLHPRDDITALVLTIGPAPL